MRNAQTDVRVPHTRVKDGNSSNKESHNGYQDSFEAHG